jgi:uncharacterized protein with GYD domain
LGPASDLGLAPGTLSKWSNSRQDVVARSTFVACGPADEIRAQPEQHERALGTPWPGLEAAFHSKAAGGGWFEGRRWGDEALASTRAHPTRLALWMRVASSSGHFREPETERGLISTTIAGGGEVMPMYLTRFSYTPETWARLMTTPEDRRAAAQQYIESVGGKLHGFWYAFGEHDGYNLWEAPDNVSMAAVAVAIGAGGALSSIQTTVLLSVEETLAALEKAQSIKYKPPGS